MLYSCNMAFTHRDRVKQLLDFIHGVTGNMQNSLQTDVCVLGFAKEFGKVGHQCLVENLKWYFIDGKINNWSCSFLSNSK